MTKQRQKHTTIALAIAKLNATQLLTLANALKTGVDAMDNADLAGSLMAFEDGAKADLRTAFGVLKVPHE